MVNNSSCVRFIAGLGVFILPMVLAGETTPVHALTVNGVNMFRTSNGPNDVGTTPGDRINYGANVVGGSLGTFLGATYPPTGFIDPAVACAPLAVNANFCNNSTAFSANRLASPWNLTFTRGAETLTVAGPSMTGADFLVPHPTNVTISGSGITPTISWTLPPGYTPDGFRVQIFDRSQLRINGRADIIHNDALPNTATSYTLPSVLETGGSLLLGGTYAINFQVIETRGDVPFTGSNAQILTRSSSFFAFSPLGPGAPPNVFLPEINSNGAFQFNIGNVGPDSVTFIDPLVAIGYDYAIGLGDPNFASVILPSVGDDVYDVFFQGVSHTVHAGDQFFFPAGGLSAFSVHGIEPSAGLDPTNPIAFVTGLTFVTTGQFTGTMTPLTLEVPPPVPEPSSFALMLAGLAMIGFIARRLQPSPGTTCMTQIESRSQKNFIRRPI
jgi:hypothetical protein